MRRPARITEPGLVYDVLNRRITRLAIFEKPEDYGAFEGVMGASPDRPGNWLAEVNRAMNEETLKTVRQSVGRSDRAGVAARTTCGARAS